MRLIVAISYAEPWSSVSRLVAYGAYGRAAGLETHFALLGHEREKRPFQVDAFSPTTDAPQYDLREITPRADDVVIFSSPSVHHAVLSHYGVVRPRFVHLIQSGLAASVVSELGYGYRLFHKPMTRIVTSQHVEKTITRFVGAIAGLQRIEAAFDLTPFSQPIGSASARTVAINTFDGELTALAVENARSRGFSGKLHIVGPTSTLASRVEAYKKSAILLCAPRLGEGVYQPIWEAMAAGCVIVTVDCEALWTLPGGVAPAHVVRQNHIEGLVNALLALGAKPDAALLAISQDGQEAAMGHKTPAEPEAATALLATFASNVELTP